MAVSSGINRVSFLSLGWGLISDVDLKTEAYRWMGDARFTVGALYFISKHRSYPAKVSMLLVRGRRSWCIGVSAFAD